MKAEELKPQQLYYSESGKYAIEIKREDEKTHLIATVTFSKESNGLLPLSCDLNDSYDRVATFLQEN